MGPKFSYGDFVRDEVTNYTGVITAYTNYYGKRPALYMVESCDRTGRPCEWWCEEGRLTLIEQSFE